MIHNECERHVRENWQPDWRSINMAIYVKWSLCLRAFWTSHLSFRPTTFFQFTLRCLKKHRYKHRGPWDLNPCHFPKICYFSGHRTHGFWYVVFHILIPSRCALKGCDWLSAPLILHCQPLSHERSNIPPELPAAEVKFCMRALQIYISCTESLWNRNLQQLGNGTSWINWVKIQNIFQLPALEWKIHCSFHYLLAFRNLMPLKLIPKNN
jgi:hypothetical protein